MIKSRYIKGKEFESKKDLFKALKSNIDIIKAQKEAEKTFSEPLSYNLRQRGESEKGVNSFTLDPLKSYHVINSTNVLDTHSDVHVKGIWNKSVNDKQGKIFFVADHTLQSGSIISFKEDVEMVVKDLKWTELGIEKEGSTQALVFVVDKANIIHAVAKIAADKNKSIEHSVRMSYVTYDLAINDDSDEYTTEKAVWDSVINLILNKEDAIEQGYFFRVSEAKIVLEGSMVLFGSNGITPILESEEEKEVITPTNIKTKRIPFVGV